MLCGINPGRNGAGKTGVPFIDFTSLSELLPEINRQDSERSAKFFFDIVSHFGPTEFFQSFYVTNISWIGYTNKDKNFNYYKLPPEARDFVYRMFQYEMAFVDPERIIAIDKDVQKTIAHLFDDRIDVSNRLPHPYHCSIPSNYDRCRDQYIETLSPFIRA